MANRAWSPCLPLWGRVQEAGEIRVLGRRASEAKSGPHICPFPGCCRLAVTLKMVALLHPTD